MQSNRNHRSAGSRAGALPHPVPVADRAARPGSGPVARSGVPVSGGRRPSRRARAGPRPRPARARGAVPRLAAGPGHRRAGRARSCSRSSSASGGARSPCAAATRTWSSSRTSSGERLGAEIASLDVDHAAAVARAFTLYFQLVNLAEERQRIRVLRTRARRAKGRPIDESIGEAVARLAADHGPRRRRGAARARSSVHPVLTAHPTEARRRTLLVALRRIRRLLDALDDPLTTPDEDADLRRRLREEITLLWHTGDLRAVLPTPLDEVRSALAIFDETLFIVVPRYVRAWTGRSTRSRRGGRSATPDAARPRRRRRPDRHPGRRRARAAPVRVVDRRGPRRAPGRDRARSRSTPRGSRPTTSSTATRPSRCG